MRLHPRGFVLGGLVLGGLVLAALALGGCAVKETRSATPPGTPATSPAASNPGTIPAALRGTYTADIEGTTATSGVWTLTITETDVLITNPHSSEPFSVDPHEVTETLMTLVPAQDCPDQSVVTTGRYSISLQGDKLTFTAVQDSCGDRKAVLSTSTWTRKP
ncbi:MAG: hypothetical protein HY264_02890 [Chloroflexi bacterium]|nr:hypothetical protein [Chloroflexota bacterium]